MYLVNKKKCKDNFCHILIRLFLLQYAADAYLRTGERLGLCLELAGPRLGGLLRRGDILLLGLGLLRGE